MVRHTLKALQLLEKDFQSVSERFGTLFIKLWPNCHEKVIKLYDLLGMLREVILTNEKNENTF